MQGKHRMSNKSKQEVGGPSAESHAANPYLTKLNQTIDDILKLNVADIKPDSFQMAHINPDNDWIYRKLSEMALMLAYAWSSPQATGFHKKHVWQQMEQLLDRVLDNARNGRWWREQPGTGDANINRFTLLPLMELFLRVGNCLAPALKEKILKVIGKAVAEQLKDYHQAKTRLRGEYPNMDAYFMLLMEEAARILDCAEYHAIALEYLGYLEACLLPGGGFIYHRGTNECEDYHQINVMILTRLWELTQASKVLELLRKTLPYYPNAVEPSGVVEYFTDPFWKHYWSSASPCALDVLATLFPDTAEGGEHRCLANIIRNSMADISVHMMMHLIWVIDYWRPEEGAKIRDPWLRYDASIRGPRGRFGTFSWAGTTGIYQDTFVGAMITKSRDKIAALQAVGVEVIMPQPAMADNAVHNRLIPKKHVAGRRMARAAYVTGHDYLRRIIVTEESAFMGVCSPLFSGAVAWEDFIPGSGWQTRQIWMLNRERLIGLIVIEQSHENAVPADAARVYLRFGGSAREVYEKDGLFFRDELAARIVKHTFAACSLEPGYAFYLDSKHTSSELILSSPVADKPPKAFMALVEILPAWHQPADIRELTDGQSIGFVVTHNKTKTVVALNCQNQAIKITDAHAGPADECYRTSSSLPCFKSCQSDASAWILPGELMVSKRRSI